MPTYFTLTPDRGYTPNQRRVQLAFLPAMPAEESNRLAGLARCLQGVSTAEPTGYLLTPGRARKCVLLFEVGFKYQPTDCWNYFSHAGGKRLTLSEALARARELTGPQQQSA